MSFSSHPLGQIGEIILGDERDADVGSNSEVESWEADPQMGEAFHSGCLGHCVEDVLVRESAVWVFLHLLHFCFGVVEG